MGGERLRPNGAGAADTACGTAGVGVKLVVCVYGGGLCVCMYVCMCLPPSLFRFLHPHSLPNGYMQPRASDLETNDCSWHRVLALSLLFPRRPCQTVTVLGKVVLYDPVGHARPCLSRVRVCVCVCVCSCVCVCL